MTKVERIGKDNSANVNSLSLRRFLTAKELTGYLPVSTATIYSLVRRRKIPFTAFGRKIIFDVLAINKWMEKRTVKSIDCIDDFS